MTSSLTAAVLPDARALVADMIRDHFHGAIIREQWSENGHAQTEDHDACTEVDALAAEIVTALSATQPAPDAAVPAGEDTECTPPMSVEMIAEVLAVAKRQAANTSLASAGIDAALLTIPVGWSWSLGQMMGLPPERRYRCFLSDHKTPDGKATVHCDHDAGSPIAAIVGAVAQVYRLWPDTPRAAAPKVASDGAGLREAVRLTIADASYHLRKYRPHCLEALEEALSTNATDGARGGGEVEPCEDGALNAFAIKPLLNEIIGNGKGEGRNPQLMINAAVKIAALMEVSDHA